MASTQWLDEWDALVARGDNGAIEEYWLERLEQGVENPASFLEALRRLRSASKKTLAASLLELGEVEAAARNDLEAHKLFLRELLRLGIGDGAQQRSDLEACIRELWGDRPSLEPFLEHFALTAARKPVNAVDALEAWLAHDVGTVVAMAGRGPGRVVEANPNLGVVRIDFEKDKRFPMPIDAAAKYLTPLEPGHFLRRRLEELDEVTREVRENPPAALEAILSSLGGSASATELKAALDGIVAPSEWTSWWNKAKKNQRVLATGSGSRLKYRLASGGGDLAVAEEILAEFDAAPLARKVDLARRHGGRSKELGAAIAARLVDAAAEGSAAAGAAWEALAQAERFGAGESAIEVARERLVQRHGAANLLDDVSDATQREGLLEYLRRADGEGWGGVFASRLERETHARVLTTLAAALVEAGRAADLEAALDRAFLNPQRSPDLFVWACEVAEEGDLGLLVASRHSGALLVRLVELAERSEFAPHRARLKEVIAPTGIAGTILQDRLTVDQARRLLQVLERPGELGENRAWLRRALPTRFPELREGGAEETHIPALAATRHRLQDELKKLVEQEIPETLRAIQVARAEGDLRENFEYHAARAKQELQSARAAQLQADLSRMRVIDPTSLDLSVVRAGASVTLEDDGGARRTLGILGPYEADPDHHVLSNQSEVAAAMLGKGVGDQVTYEGSSWRIAAIEPFSRGE